MSTFLKWLDYIVVEPCFILSVVVTVHMFTTQKGSLLTNIIIVFLLFILWCTT